MQKAYGNIQFVQFPDYDRLSDYIAGRMVQCAKEKPNALICLASGGSPEKAYRLFAQRVQNEKIDISALRFLKLDEWLGVDGSDTSTCEYYIQSLLIKPLNIQKDHYIAFDGNSSDPEKECERISEYLQENGPINLCILGIGKNGHVGLNEPADAMEPYTHIATLQAKTKTHELLTHTSVKMEKGLTIGMQNILASEKVLLLVSGSEKEEVWEQLKQGHVTPQVPCSFMWLHRNAVCAVDASRFSLT